MSPVAGGSVLGLLRHELRLVWRGSLLGGKNGVWIVAAVAVALHLVGLTIAVGIAQVKITQGDLLLAASFLVVTVSGLMLAQTIQRATEILDGQADLGWLLSSPIPPRRVLTVRLVSVATSVCIYWVLLLGPLADSMAFLGRPRVLAIYPMLASLGLLTTSLGFALTFAMLRLTSAARTKALANALATVIGASILLMGQWRVVLAPRRSVELWHSIVPTGVHLPDGILWWPARAVLGDILPLLIAVLAAVGAVAYVGWALQRGFAAGALAAIGGGAGLAPRDNGQAGVFRGGVWANLFLKEFLLLRRYPSLLGLAIYYLIYLVPVAAALWRGDPTGHGSPAKDLAVAPVLTGGELARLFVSACVRGDTVPDLAASAPVFPGAVLRAKLAAAGLGVASILIVPVLLLAWSTPKLIPAMLFGLCGVIFCNLVLGLWRPAPLRRSDLKRDQRGWGGLVNVVGLLFSLSWSLAAWLAASGNRWAFFWGGLAVFVLLLCRPRRFSSNVHA